MDHLGVRTYRRIILLGVASITIVWALRAATAASSLCVVSTFARLCLVVTVLGLLAAPAIACTVCDSTTSRDVREAFVADDDFAVNLTAAALPPVLFAATVAVVHFAWPAAKRGRRATARRGKDRA